MFKTTQSTTRLNEPPCVTLTHTKTPKKIKGSFLDGAQKRSIDCKVMLCYDGKLNIGVKLGVVASFTVLYHSVQFWKCWKGDTYSSGDFNY